MLGKHTWAIPLPIVPDPITLIFFIEYFLMPSKENLKKIFSPASVYETFWEQIYYILLSAHVLWGRRWDGRIVLK
jgi:hypothetical protein